ncbi:MAG TPA: hypothetical protein VGR68_12885 [Actinomycetota bacterium]|nr:hypothetical protein [Actinomycetota bacterium]
MPATVTVVPFAIVAGSTAWGTWPPLQVEGSDQFPDLTLLTGVAALVDGITRISPPVVIARPRTTATTASIFFRDALAAC